MEEIQFNAAMEHIIAALKERGYDPLAQLPGYITENDPIYIPSHNGARLLITKLDIGAVKKFVENMDKE